MSDTDYSVCLIYPTYNRSDIVRFGIEILIDYLERNNVDLIYFDSSTNDETERLVSNYSHPRIKYQRIDHSAQDRTIDRKVYAAASLYAGEYDWIWICRDRSIPVLDAVRKIIQSCARQKNDFIVVYPHALDPAISETRVYTDCCDLITDLCGEMTSLGSIIFSSPFLQEVVEHHPVDEVCNYGLWLPIAVFQRLAYRGFSACYVRQSLFVYLPTWNSSFWIAKDTLLWLWVDRWSTIVRELPSRYDTIKEKILMFEGWTVSPFSSMLYLACRAGGGLHFRDVYRRRKKIAKLIGKSPLKILLVSMMPPRAAACLKANLPVLKDCVVIRVLRSLYQIWQSLMRICQAHRTWQYSGCNYEDAITKNRGHAEDGIRSVLLWGNDQSLPNPFLSVLIPTYKRPNLIKDSIESVLRQDPVDYSFEIVIVDNEPYDGCKNETQSYVEELNDGRILYYRNGVNLGAGGNMNRAVELARGEWICFLHDDDLLLPDALCVVGRMITAGMACRGKPLAYIGGGHRILRIPPRVRQSLTERYCLSQVAFDARNMPIGMRRIRQFHLLAMGSVGVCAPTTGTTIRRQVFLANSGYNEEVSISTDLIFAYMLMENYSVYMPTRPLGIYRWEDNQSKRKLHKIARDLFDFREYVFRKSWINALFGFLFRMEYFDHEVRGILNIAGLPCSWNNRQGFYDIIEYKPNVARSILFYMLSALYSKWLNIGTIRVEREK